ncbi:hypothetical protein [Wolbachia endosymbiont of Ctenocephalides felis wCfeJ]|uniref:hypothetical protein n=1 Tax=Wolbachia endosymbiont of Ctenocephalides felis wCfeJ TaxID=2732594 RepID=UPI00144825EA|nr:hypothetical protein [Wolbachia endosymbiont of Ctenocephalides felis wCfeJ]WCR58420.1 MAG: hypothetical protein PG980_000892 [Wolbachia endosymbiont of Ctenocephalides felis wCfeJ]
MDLDDLTKVAFSIIKDDDPYKESKQLQIKNWGRGYLETINTENLPFFLDILSNEECWEKTNTIHGIKLNRRVVAKKMIEPQSWKGTNNPLDDFDRYQIACWCCLEEDIISLFEHFKQEDKIKDGDSDALKKLVKSVSGSWYTDAMMQFWSHFISGYISELDLEGQHPYVFGLHRAAISSRRRRVEAVEFFWDKVRSLPESELSAREKDEVFMRIAVHAAHDSGYPDVFEFCLSQISPDRYPELLKRDLERNTEYASLYRMLEMFNFDRFQKLFDFLKPCNIPEDDYYLWLKLMVKECPEHYLSTAMGIFIHVWTREGFDDHRTFTLNKEMMNNSVFQGRFLVPLVEKGFMKPVWAMLDKANSSQIKEFMSSEEANYIRSILERGDHVSLNKFLAYGKVADKELDQKNIPGPSGDLAEVEISKQSYVGLGDH